MPAGGTDKLREMNVFQLCKASNSMDQSTWSIIYMSCLQKMTIKPNHEIVQAFRRALLGRDRFCSFFRTNSKGYSSKKPLRRNSGKKCVWAEKYS